MREPIFHYRITDYDRRLVPNRLVASLDEGAVERDDWVAASGHSIGHPGWGLVYHALLTLLDPDRPNFVVETGTNVGSTAIVIGQAIIDSGRKCEFHTVEIEPEVHEEAKRRFELAGVAEIVTAHCGDSLAVLPQILDGVDEVCVAFLDGNHLHDHLVEEFEFVVDRLRHDGAVIMDNTYLIAKPGEDPRVNGALRTIQRRFGGNLVNLPFCSWYTPGMAIWQRQAFDDMEPPAVGSW